MLASRNDEFVAAWPRVRNAASLINCRPEGMNMDPDSSLETPAIGEFILDPEQL